MACTVPQSGCTRTQPRVLLLSREGGENPGKVSGRMLGPSPGQDIRDNRNEVKRMAGKGLAAQRCTNCPITEQFALTPVASKGIA
jgi:hypothetical protein